jgi:hypothetical protein
MQSSWGRGGEGSRTGWRQAGGGQAEPGDAAAQAFDLGGGLVRAARGLGMELDLVAINHWPALAYGLGSTPWGAFPGSTAADIQSGVGHVHNTYLIGSVVINQNRSAAIQAVKLHALRVMVQHLNPEIPFIRFLGAESDFYRAGILINGPLVKCAAPLKRGPHHFFVVISHLSIPRPVGVVLSQSA